MMAECATAMVVLAMNVIGNGTTERNETRTGRYRQEVPKRRGYREDF